MGSVIIIVLFNINICIEMYDSVFYLYVLEEYIFIKMIL